MTDLDLRLVRYFVAVAEHGHFGRAAEALHVAQPSLSRQVRRLEELVGTRLLERTPHGSDLTPAGRVMLDRARGVLAAADAAVADTRAAAAPHRVVVGWAGDLTVTDVVHRLRLARPEAVVATHHVRWDEVREALLDRRADVVVGRGPVEDDGLDVTVLGHQGRVLVVRRDHRLAGRAQVALADFADEPLVRTPHPLRDAFWRVDPRPDGRRAPDGPLAEQPEDKFELVASGEAVTMMPDPGPGARVPRDLVAVPVTDVEPVPTVVVTRAGETSPLVAVFVALAQDLLVAA